MLSIRTVHTPRHAAAPSTLRGEASLLTPLPDLPLPGPPAGLCFPLATCSGPVGFPFLQKPVFHTVHYAWLPSQVLNAATPALGVGTWGTGIVLLQ